jgi:hypothetical protein
MGECNVCRHDHSSKLSCLAFPHLSFISFLNFSTASFKMISSPSFLRVKSITSSVLIVVLPACWANDSRSTAAFPSAVVRSEVYHYDPEVVSYRSVPKQVPSKIR